MRKEFTTVVLLYMAFLLCLVSGNILYPYQNQSAIRIYDPNHPLIKAGWDNVKPKALIGDKQNFACQKIFEHWLDEVWPDGYRLTEESWQKQKLVKKGFAYEYTSYQGWLTLSAVTEKEFINLGKELEKSGGRILEVVYDPGKRLLIITWGVGWKQDGEKVVISLGKIYGEIKGAISQAKIRNIIDSLIISTSWPEFITKPVLRKKVVDQCKPLKQKTVKTTTAKTPVFKEKILPEERTELIRIAFIIDDFGTNLELGKKFIDLGVPITVAILPELEYSKILAEYAHEKGQDVILHLPMEPIDAKNNPGQGAITFNMSDEEISVEVEKHLHEIPYLKGMNNHMGSRVTPIYRIMETTLKELKKNGGFFVDSNTIGTSVGYEVAKELGIHTIKRDVFLDDRNEREDILLQLSRLLAKAEKRGYAVGIGHVRELTYEVLKDFLADLPLDKVQIVFISSLL